MPGIIIGQQGMVPQRIVTAIFTLHDPPVFHSLFIPVNDFIIFINPLAKQQIAILIVGQAEIVGPADGIPGSDGKDQSETSVVYQIN